MNHKLVISFLVAALLLASTGAIAQSPQAPAPQTALGTGFTYQGQLKSAGAPVNGACDLQFSLWDAAGSGSPPGGGTQVGVTQTLAAVMVTDGLFSVLLNAGNEFGTNAFAGEARWLQIAVRCPAGGGTYATLSPRQALTAAPYALSLAPNATLNGLNNTGTLSFGSITRQMLNLWGTQYGIGVQTLDTYFRTDSGAGFAWFRGGSHSDSHYNPGLMGATLMTLDGSSGLTVSGKVSASTNSSGSDAAVMAANSGSGYGLYAQSTSGAGVVAEGGTSGVIGVAGSASSSGVLGLNSLAGFGVTGSGGIGGVYGNTSNSTGGGVYGFNDGPASGTGAGVLGYGTNNAGVIAISSYGNPIVAYGYVLGDKRFVVDQSGNVFADGSYSSPAADLAEMLPATGPLAPGDVLIIGPGGKLIQSSAASQTNVAGVYSTRPAFVGGRADSADARGQVPLAVIGVVPARVSAENGAIHPGDLLVTSSTPGHAMKAGAQPSTGTVLGKALGSLDTGTGMIQILVTLQ